MEIIKYASPYFVSSHAPRSQVRSMIKQSLAALDRWRSGETGDIIAPRFSRDTEVSVFSFIFPRAICSIFSSALQDHEKYDLSDHPEKCDLRSRSDHSEPPNVIYRSWSRSRKCDIYIFLLLYKYIHTHLIVEPDCPHRIFYIRIMCNPMYLDQSVNFLWSCGIEL